MPLSPDDKCLFVESTNEYPEQQLTEGVVVSYKGGGRGITAADGEYVIRVQRQFKVEWRNVSEARVFGIADRKHAEEEAKRLNVMGGGK